MTFKFFNRACIYDFKLLLNFYLSYFIFLIESSWTSSPPRPPSPSQSQTSFDTLSRNQKYPLSKFFSLKQQFNKFKLILNIFFLAMMRIFDD